MKRTDGVYWKSTKGISGKSLVVIIFEVRTESGERVFSTAYGKGKSRKQAIKSAMDMSYHYSSKEEFGEDYEVLKDLFVISVKEFIKMELSHRSQVSLFTREDYEIDSENLVFDTMEETSMEFMYKYSMPDSYYALGRHFPLVRYYSKTWRKS